MSNWALTVPTSMCNFYSLYSLFFFFNDCCPFHSYCCNDSRIIICSSFVNNMPLTMPRSNGKAARNRENSKNTMSHPTVAPSMDSNCRRDEVAIILKYLSVCDHYHNLKHLRWLIIGHVGHGHRVVVAQISFTHTTKRGKWLRINFKTLKLQFTIVPCACTECTINIFKIFPSSALWRLHSSPLNEPS